jgi:hypothetical protein
MTTVVNIKNSRYYILIDRRTPLGNPFIIGKDGDRQQVIEKHKAWIDEYLLNGKEIVIWCNGRCYSNKFVVEQIQKGKLTNVKLGCHCYPKPCHGDYLAVLANKISEGTRNAYHIRRKKD